MARIGVLYGMEESFPPALVDHINARGVNGVTAEHLKVGGVQMAERQRVCRDRGPHLARYSVLPGVPEERGADGTKVINNPFWWSADDKFFNYALAAKLGVAVPRDGAAAAQVASRGHHRPLDAQPGISARLGRDLSLRGFPGVSETASTAAAGRTCTRCTSRRNCSRPTTRAGDLCMTLQAGGQIRGVLPLLRGRSAEGARHARTTRGSRTIERYVPAIRRPRRNCGERVVGDALKLCRALGYDLNTVEFAVEDGVPYAIDFMNPAPDADLESVGPENFRVDRECGGGHGDRAGRWPPSAPLEFRWARFLGSEEEETYERGIESISRALNIGIEEEYQTIDPVTRDLRSHIDAEIMQKGKMILEERVKPEMHQSVVEDRHRCLQEHQGGQRTRSA